MTAEEELTVEDRIIGLFQHLGIERAHIAASIAGDLHELLQTWGDSIASLTLVSPHGFGHDVLSPFESRLLLVTGEHGAIAEQVFHNMAKLPTATHVALQDYHGAIWSDIAAEHTNEVTSALGAFLENLDQQRSPAKVRLPEGQGEAVIRRKWRRMTASLY